MTRRQIWLQSQMNKAQVQEDWARTTAIATLIWRAQLEESVLRYLRQLETADRQQILEEMPPFHGGGEMIVSVALEKSTFKKPPHRFEAGTPNIAGAIGLAAAIDYIEGIGRKAISEHDSQLVHYADLIACLMD